MGYRAALLNFTKGVIAPELEARFDLPAYQAGLRQALNVKIRRTGGVSKRMGTRYVAHALGSTSRLLPFQFSDDQAYALEHEQALMRPYALGGAILEEGLKVTGITLEPGHAKITVAYHDYSVGDLVYFKEVPGTIQINDRFLEVTEVIDANNFRVNIDSRNFGALGADTGIVRTGPPSAPPAPPTVPPPLTPPTGPDVGSGSSGGYDSGGNWRGYDPYTRTYL